MHANKLPDFANLTTIRDYENPPEGLRGRSNTETCYKAFHAGVRILIPNLRASWELDEDVTRFS